MPRISGGGLYQYLQSVQGYLAPPITAVFLLGIFNDRINARGATWGLAVGFILGFLKLTIQAFFGVGKIESPAFLAAVGDFNFLYFSGVLFFIVILLVVITSATAPPPDSKRLTGLTMSTVDRDEVRASWTRSDVVVTGIILALIVGIYGYFSFWI
jgi:SSS family solute:Na+ symporter